MKQAQILVNKYHKVSPIDERIYGSFIEHMGRAVYTGIYEPDHPNADEEGFRKDVLSAISDLNVPIVRYPGGNFLSGYDWKDGIGPKEDRPTRLDYAWFSIEKNQFGIDEFANWAKKANTSGMIAVNLGTGTPKDAGELIEYCNIDKGTKWSDLRRANGHEEPHNFKVWCLGNEMDGPWQTCQQTAENYALKAKETAKILKWVDPDIEVVACGSSGKEMETFPEWDLTVLDTCYDYVDFISLHRYYEYNGNVGDFLASFYDLDDFIHTIKAAADYAKAKNRSDKTMYLSLDEWNVWYIKHMDTKRWQEHPAIAEDVYSLLDALVVGGLLCTIVNNADRVKMACLAQLVNALAPIHTAPGGDVLLHATYYPFRQVSRYGKGEVIKNTVICDPIMTEKYGEVPALQTVTTYDEATKQMAVFILNTEETESISVNLDIQQFNTLKMVDHEILSGDDLFAVNSFEKPENVIPKKDIIVDSVENSFSFELPPLSWHMLRFEEA